jgi:hypothetical protein
MHLSFNSRSSIRRVLVAMRFMPGLILLLNSSPSVAQVSDDGAARAEVVLQENCAMCHGGAGAYRFDVNNLASLVEAKVIRPGNADGSEMIQRLESGAMPLGGYKGQPGVKLPEADLQTLRKWIDAGAQTPAPRDRLARRPFISESETLMFILRDLDAAPRENRPYLRYFSLVNLWNDQEVDDSALSLYRTALSKLVNHLSWNRKITPARALGVGGVLLRIDLRDYGWTTPTWNRITAAYPYAVTPKAAHEQTEQIRILSGAIPPYVRADWFTAKASVAPLYHEILRLPDTLEGLEHQLSVDAGSDIQSEQARRFGVRNSGVSRNNRAMERHPTPYGAYWKSFDFGGSRIEQNIFRDPVNLTPDGGEMIFNLPNGLQGYLIVNGKGKRIDDAPANIVRDRTNSDDSVVHNGRSCMGCHLKGMNAFQDEVAASLERRKGATFDVDRAAALYPGQSELERFLVEDNKRFAMALDRTGGGVPAGLSREPINELARHYERTLSVSDAAAELDFQDPKELQRRVENSTELQRQGFDPLLGLKGGIQRDTWEQSFERIAQELGFGPPLFSQPMLNVAAGRSLLVELVEPLDTRASHVGDQVWFRSVEDLPVDGRAAIPRGCLVRGAITQVQPGSIGAKPSVQFALDEARFRDGTTLRLPASVLTMRAQSVAPSASARTRSAIDGVAKSVSTWKGSNNASGWWGTPNNKTIPMDAAPKVLEQDGMLPQGAMFEARF